MKYQKPEVVAKSAAKESFVGGCPTERPVFPNCSPYNDKCLCGALN